MRNARGFTLVELITALVLFGIVGTALYQLLVNNQRVYRQQAERVGVNESARAVVTIMPGEIRELSAGGGDIVAMTNNALTYKSMRGFYSQCRAPDTGNLDIFLAPGSFFGLQRVDAARDSILIFAEGDSTTRMDDGWLHANVTSVTSGTACPGGAASVTVRLSGVTPAQLTGVQAGAPVRNFVVSQILLYPDAGGNWWCGGRTFNKASGWSGTQPLVGPMSAAGLAFTYYSAAGSVTGVPTAVARIGIGVQSRSTEMVRGTGGTSMNYMLEDLLTHVAVRNNPLY